MRRAEFSIPTDVPKDENELALLTGRVRSAWSRVKGPSQMQPPVGLGFLWRIRFGTRKPNVALMWTLVAETMKEMKPDYITESRVEMCDPGESPLLIVTLEGK